MTLKDVRLRVGVGHAMPYPAPALVEPSVAAHPPVVVEPLAAETPSSAPPHVSVPLATFDDETSPGETPSPAPSAAAVRGRGGRLAGLLRRPAAYLRAYLTASVDHQLQAQARRTADLWGAAVRLERRSDHLVVQAHAQAEREGALAVRLDHVSAHTGLTAANVEHVSVHLEGVSGILGHVSGRLAGVSEHLAGMSERLAGVSERLAEVERRQDRLAAAASAERAESAAMGADQLALARRIAAAGDHAVERLDEVLGVLGPRFDELDIKIRPLIEVDELSTAVRTADGYVMLPRSEPLFVTAVANASSGGLEPGTRRVLRALLRPGDACADVGANVGLLTAAMAFAVGPSGRVWAFEPEARVRDQLARTLHLNGLHQVVLSGAAVGAQAGRLTFNQSPIIGHSSLYPLPEEEQAQARPVEVEVVRLDDVVPSETPLAVVKIDVEGAELDVLRGMARAAADSPDLAVVAEFGPSHLARVGIAPADWFAAFAAFGLEPRLIAEPSGLVSPVTVADLAGVESANLVFVRPGGAADGRLPR